MEGGTGRGGAEGEGGGNSDGAESGDGGEVGGRAGGEGEAVKRLGLGLGSGMIEDRALWRFAHVPVTYVSITHSDSSSHAPYC